MRRKEEVVAAVRGGLLSLEHACERYAISMDEFLAWKGAMDLCGPSGLRVTRARRSQTATHSSSQRRGVVSLRAKAVLIDTDHLAAHID